MAAEELKNGPSPGEDRITAEMLENKFFKTMRESEKEPKNWTRSTLVKLFRNGDTTKCENWCGTCLLSIAGKLYALTIINRLKLHLDRHLREQQHGFRPNRSCTDLIFVLKMLLEENNEGRRKLYFVFIDFEKAFDSGDRAIL